MTRVAGALAVHTVLDLENRKAVEAHARAMLFRGYEIILQGRDPRNAIDMGASLEGGTVEERPSFVPPRLPEVRRGHDHPQTQGVVRSRGRAPGARRRRRRLP
ncbi:MAG: hypothetical protein M3P85_13445 [Actinomycetota bacterium]|nr:hypothetical protein [Actinomycetota bacterium]